MDNGQPDVQGLEQNGMLKPPEAFEQTEVKSEGLAKAEEAKPMEVKTMTLDEADLMRAERFFLNEYQYTKDEIAIIHLIKVAAFNFCELIIKSCPAGKERSQADGQIKAAVIWAIKSIEMK